MGKQHKKKFSPVPGKKVDFSYFFNHATAEEHKKLMEVVVRKANQDQRDFIEKYLATHDDPEAAAFFNFKNKHAKSKNKKAE